MVACVALRSYIRDTHGRNRVGRLDGSDWCEAEWSESRWILGAWQIGEMVISVGLKSQLAACGGRQSPRSGGGKQCYTQPASR